MVVAVVMVMGTRDENVRASIATNFIALLDPTLPIFFVC